MDKQKRMRRDLQFFIECVSGRKIDPAMITGRKADWIILDDVIPNTIASCKPAMPVYNSKSFYEEVAPLINNQEGEKPMYTECTPCAPCGSKKCRVNDVTISSMIATSTQVPVEATQRDFAVARVNQIRYQHNAKLREQFFMDSDKPPQTARDLIKAIKEDAFRLDEKLLIKNEESLSYYSLFYGIDWGKNIPDHDGYEVARKALETEAQEVIDTITLGTVEEGRKALDAFKTWALPTSTTAA